MTDRTLQGQTNNKTSAPAPTNAGFAASTRTKNDRSSEGGQGNQADSLPNNGYDKRGLFRTPFRFPRPSSNGGGSASRVQGEAGIARQVPSSDGRSSDKSVCWCGHAQSTHYKDKGCCLVDGVGWCACEQFEVLPTETPFVFSPYGLAVLEPTPNHLSVPHFSADTILFVGAWATLAFIAGWCFGMGVGR